MVSSAIVAGGSAPRKYFSSRARLASESSVVFDIPLFPFIIWQRGQSNPYYFPQSIFLRPPRKTLQDKKVSKRHRQSGQAPQTKVFSPGDWTGIKAKIWHSTQHRLEGDLAFYACQWRTKAEVAPPCKGHVPVILAANIEPIWIRETLWIAVRRTHHRYDRLTLANRFPSENHIFRSQAGRMLAGAFIAQQFFNGGRHQ